MSTRDAYRTGLTASNFALIPYESEKLLVEGFFTLKNSGYHITMLIENYYLIYILIHTFHIFNAQTKDKLCNHEIEKK